MSILLEKFNYGIRWNAFESVIYQSLLLIHNFCLFAWMPYAEFGVIGSLFSTVYLIISFINFGFDTTLPAYFSQAISSKLAFKKIIIVHYLPEIILVMLIATACLIAPYFFLQYIRYPLDPFLITILGLIIISESIKKTLRTIMHLSFLNKLCTLTELIFLFLYLSLVWLPILRGTPITPFLIFTPLLLSSVLSTVILGYYVLTLYNSLDHCPSVTLISHRTIITNRFWNYLSHISHGAFSSNFLVPLMASINIESAAFLKISSTIVYALISCSRSAFGSASEAAFSFAKNFDVLEKRSLFYSIITKFNTIILSTFLFCIIFLGSIAVYKLEQAKCIAPFLLCIAALSFLEHAVLIHEKFLIAEEKSYLLSVWNFIFFLISIAVIKSMLQANMLTLLMTLIFIRTVSWLVIHRITLSYHKNSEGNLKTNDAMPIMGNFKKHE